MSNKYWGCSPENIIPISGHYSTSFSSRFNDNVISLLKGCKSLSSLGLELFDLMNGVTGIEVESESFGLTEDGVYWVLTSLRSTEQGQVIFRCRLGVLGHHSNYPCCI